MGAAKNLVLGGSGTIGSALCRHLISIGESVTNLDLKDGFDLRKDSLDPFRNHDYVWFLAWDVGGAKYLSDPRMQHSMMANNIAICQNVFGFLQETRIPFLFSSSQLAAPESAYGVVKLLGEHWTRLLEGTTARFWNVYGWEEPGEKSHVIPDLVMQALNQKKIRLMTTGEEERQFIYMDDCVKNLIFIRSGNKKAVHLTNGQWISIGEVARLIGQLMNVPVEAGTMKGYQNKIDPNPSYKDFAWSIPLDEGIRQIINKALEFTPSKPLSL